MSRIVIPILLFVASGILSFAYSADVIRGVNDLRVQKAEIDNALLQGAQLEQVKSQKLTSFNDITPENRNRINKFLPDNIDSVQLIIDINEIAARRGLTIRNISVKVEDSSAEGTVGPDNRDFGLASLSFSVSAPYDLFKLFLADIEDSLRLIDIMSLSFTAGDRDLYEYNLDIKTYWLR